MDDNKNNPHSSDDLDNFDLDEQDAVLRGERIGGNDDDAFPNPAEENDFSLEHQDEKMAKAAHSPGVLSYNNRRYAVGLTWLTVDEDADPNLAKERAKRLDADYYCFRNTIVAQHGFGYVNKGHKMGMNAAGALAADALIGEWHGVFVAENGWWYLAVHGDTVEPDGDIFFVSEEEAYNYFMEMNDGYQWPRSYAPDSWNVPHSNGEIPLEKLFNDMPATILKPASIDAIFGGKRNKQLALIFGAILIGVLVFALFAKEMIPNLIPEQKKAPTISVATPGSLTVPRGPSETAEDEEAARRALGEAELPQPSKVLNACLEAFADLARPLPGWRLEILRCRNGLAEARWRRTSGSFETAKPFLSRFPFGVNPPTYDGSSTIIASKVITNIRDFNRTNTLPERNVAILTLNGRFANSGTVSAKEVIPEIKRQQTSTRQRDRGARRLDNIVKGRSEEATTQKRTIGELPYLDIEMRFSSPPNLITGLFDIEGFTFDMIEWNITQQSWKYDGRIILKPDEDQLNRRAPQKNPRRR